MSENNLFIIPRPVSNPRLRLFCFPYAGGSAATYQSWGGRIPSDVELVIIHPPGRASRLIEKPHLDMNSLMLELMGEYEFITSLPYILLGHSLGSRVAYELASKIQQKGGRAPDHFIASGSRAPHLLSDKKRKKVTSDDEFILELKALGGTPDDVLENDELIEVLMPMLRADFGIAERYQADEVQIACAVTVLSGDEDSEITEPQLLAWGDLTGQDCKIEYISGGHFFIEESHEEVMDVLNSLLKKVLADGGTKRVASSTF